MQVDTIDLSKGNKSSSKKKKKKSTGSSGGMTVISHTTNNSGGWNPPSVSTYDKGGNITSGRITEGPNPPISSNSFSRGSNFNSSKKSTRKKSKSWWENIPIIGGILSGLKENLSYDKYKKEYEEYMKNVKEKGWLNATTGKIGEDFRKQMFTDEEMRKLGEKWNSGDVLGSLGYGATHAGLPLFAPYSKAPWTKQSEESLGFLPNMAMDTATAGLIHFGGKLLSGITKSGVSKTVSYTSKGIGKAIKGEGGAKYSVNQKTWRLTQSWLKRLLKPSVQEIRTIDPATGEITTKFMQTISHGGTLKKIITPGVLMALIGTYPFAGFLKEESLQTLGFAYKTAKENGDIAGMRAALDEQKNTLDPPVWGRIIEGVPFANTQKSLHGFYKSARAQHQAQEKEFQNFVNNGGTQKSQQGAGNDYEIRKMKMKSKYYDLIRAKRYKEANQLLNSFE